MDAKYCSCGKLLKWRYAKKCRSCAVLGRIPWNKGKSHLSGEKNPSWKGGKPKCLDCGIRLSAYKTKRCRSCQNAILRKKPELKTCTYCKKILPINKFTKYWRKSRNRFSYSPDCYECHKNNMFMWRSNNRIKRLNYQIKRDLLCKDLTLEIIQKVYEDNIIKYGRLTCYLCLSPISFKEDSIDHKTPLSRGGGNREDNLGIAHIKCNCIKHNKTENEYRQYMEETNGSRMA
jgi:5-methylcytosine-specific restriction endonuclease McrA